MTGGERTGSALTVVPVEGSLAGAVRLITGPVFVEVTGATGVGTGIYLAQSTGAVVASMLPWLLTGQFGVSNEAPEGVIPDSARCVAISTKASLREMLIPGGLAVFVPLIIGFISVDALGGFLAGALVSGFCLAIFMANAGGAWDNAKKYIEQGNHGGKGSDPHKAAVVGDTVGDPFKDTSGPAMNILIKVMTIVSLVFAGAFV